MISICFETNVIKINVLSGRGALQVITKRRTQSTADKNYFERYKLINILAIAIF